MHYRLALMLSLAATTSAAAQDQAKNVKIAERTYIDFDVVGVQGELIKPTGSTVHERKEAQFPPLIELRANFNRDMVESIDAVK